MALTGLTSPSRFATVKSFPIPQSRRGFERETEARAPWPSSSAESISSNSIRCSAMRFLVRNTARQFIEDNLIPIIEQCNRAGRFPRELVKPMADLGFFGAS